MESIWSMESSINRHNQLQTDLKTHVLIIGGGMAGLLTAYMLSKKNIDYVLIESGEITGGVTKNTTAKITYQHNLLYNELIEKFGSEKAAQYFLANKEAIDMYERIVTEENINCEFKKIPSYLYAHEDITALEAEHCAVNSIGIKAVLTDQTTLPFKVRGALRFDNQAQFNPLAFISHISKGLTIYEQTKAISIEGRTVETTGGTITADYIVMATHFPFINKPGYYFMRMHQERSYVIALKNAGTLDGAYLGIDKVKYSFRSYKDTIVLGGGAHRTGENEGGKYDELRSVSHAFYPDAIETASWSAQDCITHDKIPYIGKFSSTIDNLYVITGFNKWGMSTSMAAAMMIADEIAGKATFYNVFSPQRSNISAAAKGIAVDSYEAVTGLIKQYFQIPPDKLNEIEIGESAIIDFKNEKVGVYKDNAGKIFMVSTKCPHLGCMLTWNPDELSWDCPCHGSRFDYEGRLLNNPATNSIESERIVYEKSSH